MLHYVLRPAPKTSISAPRMAAIVNVSIATISGGQGGGWSPGVTNSLLGFQPPHLTSRSWNRKKIQVLARMESYLGVVIGTRLSHERKFWIGENTNLSVRPSCV